MQIKRIKLLNFRNHKKLDLNFAKTTLIIGPNGSGKTSILEALSLLSTSKTPRTTKYNEVVFWNAPRALIECRLVKPGGERMIRLLIEKGGFGFNKTFSLDGKIIEPKNVIGELKTVYFSPETLEIITGSPKERRRFLDILISQTDPRHLADLIEYNKIIINRNRLLKKIAYKKRDKDEIIFWDEKLVDVGSKIMRLRKKVCRELGKYLAFYYKKVAGVDEGITLNYLPSVVQHTDQQDLESAFFERLVSDFDLETKYGSTLFGPHRDDLGFGVGGKNAAHYCSRGEIRSIIVSLKLAEVEYIKKKTGEKPVILLDDIYSELDGERSKYLSRIIVKNVQSVITSTHRGVIAGLDSDFLKVISLTPPKAYARAVA